jgi:hypothetical protein
MPVISGGTTNDMVSEVGELDRVSRTSRLAAGEYASVSAKARCRFEGNCAIAPTMRQTAISDAMGPQTISVNLVEHFGE